MPTVRAGVGLFQQPGRPFRKESKDELETCSESTLFLPSPTCDPLWFAPQSLLLIIEYRELDEVKNWLDKGFHIESAGAIFQFSINVVPENIDGKIETPFDVTHRS